MTTPHPHRTRPLRVRAESYDATARTVRACVATDAPVRRWGCDEVLVARGCTVADRIPLLDSHDRESIDTILGSLVSAAPGTDGERETVEGVLELAEPVTPGDRRAVAASLVAQGHLDALSGGYRVERSTFVPRGQRAAIDGRDYEAAPDADLEVVTHWTLREASLLAIGADEYARLRGDTGMADRADGANAPADVTPAPAPAAPQAHETETERARSIARLAIGARAPEVPQLVERAIAERWDVARATAAVLDAERAARPQSVGIAAPQVQTRETADRDLSLRALSLGLSVACGAKAQVPSGATASERERHERSLDVAEREGYTHLGVLDTCREALRLHGIHVPMGARAVVSQFLRSASGDGVVEHIRGDRQRSAAGSTLSLTNVFTTAVQAMLQESFDEEGDPYAGVFIDEDVKDFMLNPRPRALVFDDLTQLPAGAEADHVAIGDTTEGYYAHRYAAQWVIDEQDMINDRLGVFTESPMMAGAAAKRVRPNLIALLLLQANTAGLSAGGICTTGNANYASGGSSALDSTSLKAALTAMRKQRETSQGGDKVNLNVVPKWFIGGAAHEWTIDQLVNSGMIVITGTTDSVQGNRNSLQNKVTPVIDARLDNGVSVKRPDGSRTTVSGSSTAWWLASDGRRPRTIRVGYVQGTGRAPVLRSQVLTHGRFGLGYDVHIDVGAGAQAYQGLYMSAGA